MGYGYQQHYESRMNVPYGHQVVGADTLFGGDIGNPSGGAHFIADSWATEERALPDFYHSKNAQALRDMHGAKPGQGNLVRTFVDENGLQYPFAFDTAIEGEPNPLRQEFGRNTRTALVIMVETALAIAESRELPAYEDRYKASTGMDPEFVDTTPHREELRAALAELGFETTSTRDLEQTVAAWEHDLGFVPAERFGEEVSTIRAQLMPLIRKNILSQIDFSKLRHGTHLEDASFNGLKFKNLSGVDFTGSSAYLGGLTNDYQPALKGLFEYNTDHPITPVGLWHLVAHEGFPGHYMDSAIADLGWQAGKREIERVVHTMCTGETVLREGWAQNALAMAFGGKESDVSSELGPDHRVHYALERLQDAGKNNASILHQLHGMSLDEVRQHLAVKCVLNPAFVKKLSGSWAQHPIVGPMYGPAYAVGYQTVRDGIDQKGPKRVAELALHQKGYLDIQTFQKAIRAS